jgi:FMN hydrolase / 5-amino-6-(5-phospho-D-ribitylamino)uracil phosphatase
MHHDLLPKPAGMPEPAARLQLRRRSGSPSFLATPMQAVKAVLFDLDETLWPIAPVILRAEAMLFDWLTLHAPAVAQCHTIDSLRQHRKAMAKDDPCYAYDLQKLRHAALSEVFRSCGEDPANVEHAMQLFNMARNLVTPYQDVLPVLSALNARLAIGSVSNGSADLESIGLAHFFRVSVAAHRLGRAKPDPEIFHVACARLGVVPEETVYVGDDPLLDVVGAQNAGLLAVWLNRPDAEPPRMLPAHVQPAFTCQDLYGLEAWLSERIMHTGLSPNDTRFNR